MASIGVDIFFHRELIRMCDELTGPVKNDLISGQFKDYGTAQWMVGYIKAATDILERADDLRRRIIES